MICFRQNFRNISNNFVQGGVIQSGMNLNQQQTRQTRSSNVTSVQQAPLSAQLPLKVRNHALQLTPARFLFNMQI